MVIQWTLYMVVVKQILHSLQPISRILKIHGKKFNQ